MICFFKYVYTYDYLYIYIIQIWRACSWKSLYIWMPCEKFTTPFQRRCTIKSWGFQHSKDFDRRGQLVERCGFRFKLENLGCQCFNSYREKKEKAVMVLKENVTSIHICDLHFWFGFHNVSSTFRRYFCKIMVNPCWLPKMPTHHKFIKVTWMVLVRFRNCFSLEDQGKNTTNMLYGGFLKWRYPTTMGVPTKNDHFGVF